MHYKLFRKKRVLNVKVEPITEKLFTALFLHKQLLFTALFLHKQLLFTALFLHKQLLLSTYFTFMNGQFLPPTALILHHYINKIHKVRFIFKMP